VKPTSAPKLALSCLLLFLSFVAAACGGDGGSSQSEPGGGGPSGTISMLAVWTGSEGRAIRAVLKEFHHRYPNTVVKYTAATDPAQALSTSVQGGNPPDIAALPSPGLMTDFARRGALKPIGFARATIAKNFAPDWIRIGTVDGKLYGLFFKGANKSTVWFNVHAFTNAGVEPPTSWNELIASAKTLRAYGLPAYSIGGADGWTLTDLFENLYLRLAGPERYDQLSRHEIPWTHPTVKRTLGLMAQVLSDRSNIAGNPLQVDFPGSITNVFQPSNPKAAMVFEGDFVPGVAAGQTKAKPKIDYDVFPFPAVAGRGGDFVVGGGDAIVMFKANPVARALVRFLATPDAAEIWAKRGGFSSPNKNVDPSVYPDDITRTTATALAGASTFRFDMSDLAPARFGSAAEFADLQALVRNPSDIDRIAAKLEADARKAWPQQ
jgi:ABC-type glycerol-3-phosphate transport system substrate-binding protein